MLKMSVAFWLDFLMNIHEENWTCKSRCKRWALACPDYKSGRTCTPFGNFSAGQGNRSAKEIIHHMHDVLYLTRYFIENEELPTEQPHGGIQEEIKIT